MSTERLFELDAPKQVFSLVERDGFRIGSGRPKGPRNEAWGACVVLARAAMEAGLKRLHDSYCKLDGCVSNGPGLDPARFKQHFEAHSIEMLEPVPVRLHLQMRQKSDPSDGDGKGTRINGPRNTEEIGQFISAFSHVRNGRAHKDELKLSRLPEHAAGVLWVEAADGGQWTIQKPHAMSALRFSELLFRVVAWWSYGESAALLLRSNPVRFLVDQVEPVEGDEVLQAIEVLKIALTTEDSQRTMESMESLKYLLIRQHVAGSPSAQMALPGLERSANLHDPFLNGVAA